ncbi:MAG: hypothetical protein E7051_08205 [Lentisphaerae bacterium]|nr:hypothetical protein [Lentisphaerota bacterium]
MKKLLFLAAMYLIAASAGSFRFTDGTGFELDAVNKETLKGNFFVRERSEEKIKEGKGVITRTLKLSEEKSNRADQKILVTKDFKLTLTLKDTFPMTTITATVKNLSDKQLLLEPGMRLSVKPLKGDQFWAGFDILDAEDKELGRQGYKGRYSKHISGGVTQPFPTASLIGNGRAIILGGRLFEISSWDSGKYVPRKKSGASLYYSRRIVVEPGKEVTNTYFAGSVPVRFDVEQNVVEAYYETIPSDFRPFVGKDNPYIRGAHCQYSTWARKPNFEAERRRFTTIDWAYTPYKRSGDSYGRKELWDYKPLVCDFKVTFGQLMRGEGMDYKKLTWEQFHKRRKEIFHESARKYGYSFYTCIGWCEKQLAETIYKDSLAEDKSVALELAPWSVHHDRERRVFMYGNSYGKAFMEDLAKLSEELDLPGFAFDCGAPGVNHYGAAAKNPEVDGRAWDEKGVFIDELCGVNQIVDYVHKLRPSDPLYVWKNGGGNCDMQMIETDLFGSVFPSWMPHMRYGIGQRPAVLHVREGYMYQETIPDWNSLTQDEFIQRWSKLGDHLTFSDFEYGMTNSYYGYGGNRLSQYAMPELLECIDLGWRALVPVATDGLGEDQMLYKARYGRQADTILFFGNPYEKPINIKFTVDNYGLGGKYQLFLPKMRDFANMENRIVNGDTVFSYALPSRRPVLFEAAFGLDKLPASGKLGAKVSSKKDIHKMTYTAELDNDSSFTAVVTPREVENFTVELKINGNTVAAGTSVELPANAKIEAVYTSKLFGVPAMRISTFPFIGADGKPQVAVKLPDNPNAAEKEIAGHIQGYFDFTAAHKMNSKAALPAWKEGMWTIEVTVGRGKGDRIERKGRTIYLHSSTDRKAILNYKALARVMDRRFEYFMPFVVHSNQTNIMARKFDQKTLLLPYSRCFESAFAGGQK